MEAERGLVYPHQTILNDVDIDVSSYAMVKVDMVHENSKDLKLESATRRYDADYTGCSY
jgi:hypothetical protein